MCSLALINEIRRDWELRRKRRLRGAAAARNADHIAASGVIYTCRRLNYEAFIPNVDNVRAL